ncbi:MAG: hypothetical protein V1831_01380 [Candidatus Woesearchaeota archaeon]
MKIIKRVFILQFLFLLAIPLVLGEISTTLPEKSLYNFGEKIAPFVSLKQDMDYDGFFSLDILCDNYGLQYYAIPLALEAGMRTQLNVPELSLSKLMTGKCYLRSSFEASDGEAIDTGASKDFVVTNKVNILIDEELGAKPGEDITISGEVRKQSNEIMPKGEAKISFNGNEEKVGVVSGNFEHVIHLDSDIEAGDIPMVIVVTDKYGNYGDKVLKVKVLPIPTRIENNLENSVLMPGDTLRAKVVLYDHSSKAINGTKIHVKIFGPGENLIAEKDIQNMNYFEFETEKSQKPGTYYILSAFEDVKGQDSFIIQEVKKIVMSQTDNFVYVENVGNVNYDDKVTIVLESNDKKYLINKKINLEPGEKITIDLSKEVPQGTYDITLPEEAVVSGAEANAEGEDALGVTEEQNVIEGVPIEDNRNAIKKTADGMSGVTGAVVGAAGYVASRPLLATTLLILIILGTVARYSKDFIIGKIKGKKEDDTSHLFEDFKFDKENEDNRDRD